VKMRKYINDDEFGDDTIYLLSNEETEILESIFELFIEHEIINKNQIALINKMSAYYTL